jgi:hypothetical protein
MRPEPSTSPAEIAADVARFLRLLHEPGSVFEVRAPKCPAATGSNREATASGYFNDIETAARAIAALEHSAEPPGIYVTLNPVKPELVGRADNRVNRRANTTTADADIVARGRILIDCDPVRPAGTSSTDAELQCAEALAQSIVSDLTESGWPEPLLGRSGNGYHLIYAVDLPAGDDGLVSRVLTALAARYSDERVKVDTSVHNPSRITKVLGTMARKGEDLRGVEGVEDRPHRRSCIISARETLKPVPSDLLEHLAGEAPCSTSKPARRAKERSATPSEQAATKDFELFDLTPESVQGYLERHGVHVKQMVPKSGLTLLHLEQCPVVPGCVSENGSDISVIVDDDGKISYKNMHDRGNGLTWADVRDALEPGYRAFQEQRDGASSGGSRSKGGRSQADRLLALVKADEGVELFHSPMRDAFARVRVDDHHETLPVASRAFKEWLSRQLYLAIGKVPGRQALETAANTIAGIAKFDGPECEVHVRIAGCDSEVWFDLGTPDWSAVRIGPDGWSFVPSDRVPVRFVRPTGLMPLPVPVPGGSIEELRPLVNLPDEDDWILCVSWIIGAFHPTGPYGVLAIHGEQGSAKSTLSRYARQLIDPNAANLRRPPRDERDVFVGAHNSWVSSFNNLSSLSTNISDAFCALATDGGFSTRTLYADREETIFSARRPVILNGIDMPAHRSDLVDRTISLHLRPIPDDRRREESILDAEFERVRPRVLGALLDGVSSALRNRDNVRIERLPRMADLAVWVTAAEEGLGWERGRFVAAYWRNRDDSRARVVEMSAVGQRIVELVKGLGEWKGTASELRAELSTSWTLEPPPDDWPTNYSAMSGALRRIAPDLAAVGVSVEMPRKGVGHDKRRIIRLKWIGPPLDGEAGAEEPAANAPESGTTATPGAAGATPNGPQRAADDPHGTGVNGSETGFAARAARAARSGPPPGAVFLPWEGP